MCGPAAIPLIGLAFSVAATGYTVYEQNQIVKAQNKINQQAADEGAELAAESFKNQANQVRLRDAQEAEATAQDRFENSRKAAEARESARVSSGEAGVSGVSVDNLLADYYGQEAEYNTGLSRNLEFSQAQSNEDLRGLRSGAVDRSIGSRRPMLQKPSYLAAGLSMANNALGTYDNFKYRTDKTYRGEG